MKSALEGVGHLERELSPEPFAAPAIGALALHGALLAALVAYGLLSGLFKHNLWGNQGAGGGCVGHVESHDEALAGLFQTV